MVSTCQVQLLQKRLGPLKFSYVLVYLSFVFLSQLFLSLEHSYTRPRIKSKWAEEVSSATLCTKKKSSVAGGGAWHVPSALAKSEK